MTLSWAPATYQSDPGGYVLEYGLSSGVYTTTETIADKTANTFTVTGLVEGGDYYFHIGTYTDPHASNQNTVYSDYSDELQAQTPVNTDTDGDGLPDAWEQQIIDADANDAIVTFADVLPGDDFDDDGVTNADELANGISPINPDSDGDGYNDGQEIAAGTSPLDNTDYEAGPQRAALMALYDATNGDGWTNNSGWKSAPLAADGFAYPGTECSWSGVVCDIDQVTRLEFQGRNLNGIIPAELGNLSDLTALDLSDNVLSGTIPSELGNLTNLTYLELSANQLSGSIPSELGNLSSLIQLRLANNQLSGSIPVELGNMLSLTRLELGLNQLFRQHTF